MSRTGRDCGRAPRTSRRYHAFYSVVGRLGRGDVIKERLDCDPCLQSGERRARADVRPTTEGKVAPAIRPVEPEIVRVVEPRLVTVGRFDAEHDLVVRRASSVFRCSPAAVQSRSRNRTGGLVRKDSSIAAAISDTVRAQLFQQVRVMDQPLHEIADQVPGRLVAGNEQEDELRAGLDVGEPTSIDLARQQSADEIVLRWLRGDRRSGRRRTR